MSEMLTVVEQTEGEEMTTITKARKSGAIKTMQEELNKILLAQIYCVDDWGIVKTGMRYRYNELTKQAKTLKDSIEWMEKLYSEKE
jgi:hypothetical protein